MVISSPSGMWRTARSTASPVLSLSRFIAREFGRQLGPNIAQFSLV
jgi:hypothetical protein